MAVAGGGRRAPCYAASELGTETVAVTEKWDDYSFEMRLFEIVKRRNLDSKKTESPK